MPLPVILLLLWITGTLGVVVSFSMSAFGWLVAILLVAVLAGAVFAPIERRRAWLTLRGKIRLRHRLGYDTTELEGELPKPKARASQADKRYKLGYDRPEGG